MKFLFCADMHLRIDRPRCRKDEDWIGTQKKQLEHIRDLSRDLECPIAIAGDIFHTSQVHDTIKNMFIKTFYNSTVSIIAGQHDLPYHSWERVDSSSFGVLWNSSGNILSMGSLGGDYMHFGSEIENTGDDSDILFMHKLIFKYEKDIPPNANAYLAREILEQYPGYKWILCGDNHHGFHYQKNGRHLIMAGCMNRQAINFKDYNPTAWFIDTDTDEVKPHFIPDDPEMIVPDSYFKAAEERKERMTAFIEEVKNSKGISLDFKSNVEAAIPENNFSNLEKEIILELMQEA